MANDRVSRSTAELIPMPPNTWYIRKINWLLEQPKVKENIKSVPLNEPLMDSLLSHGMKAPILTMPNWYPIAGSQRLRAYAEIVKDFPELGEQEIRVCRIDKEYWLVWYLWGDKDFRDKAVAIYFQVRELNPCKRKIKLDTKSKFLYNILINDSNRLITRQEDAVYCQRTGRTNIMPKS